MKILFTLLILLVITPSIQVKADDFDELLNDFRQDFLSPIEYDLGLEQIIIDDSLILHRPPEYITPETDGVIGIQPLSAPYVLGSRRGFIAHGFPGLTQGQLVRQGTNVNIWVLDGTHGTSGQQVQITTNTALLNDMVTRFDDIITRMSRDFAPFRGVVINTPFTNMPRVGDIRGDGRVNVLLYNIGNKTSPPPGVGVAFHAGHFTNGDFMTNGGNVPIPLLHMDLARNFGYEMLRNNPLGFFDTFAHEFQHLLFYMYLGVYLDNPREILWFDESLSEVAGSFWSLAGSEVISPHRMFHAAVNSYAHQSGYGDFLNFNLSLKNYGMSRLYGTFMHRRTAGNFVSHVYDYIRRWLPPTRAFVENERIANSISTDVLVGNILNSANITTQSGARAFELAYLVFMEYFAADGGDVIIGNDTFSTRQFIPNPHSATNLWGIRPNMGRVPGQNAVNGVFMTSTGNYFYDLRSFAALPTLASGGNISLTGFGGSTPRGATHERMFRLTGESSANPYISIRIPDNNPRTHFYVVVPNDAVGAVSNLNNRHLGRNGATVHHLSGNNAVNVIRTGGRTVYLFAVTLFRNVNTNVTYSWHRTDPTSPTVTGVTVSPASTTIRQNATQTFTANVTGTNNPPRTVTWSVTGNTSNATRISANGVLTVAANETATTLTVRATSTFNTSVSGTASAGVIRVTNVSVSPGTVLVRQGATQNFTAAVTGTNSPPTTVTWAVTGNNSNATSISAAGVLTVAANETAANLTVRATSTVNTNISGTATVNLPTVTGVTVSPNTASIRQGATQSFTATVAGTNNPAQTVTWSVTGGTSAATRIAANGLLTVGANETAQSLTVRATSTINTGISGTASANVIVIVRGVTLNHRSYSFIVGNFETDNLYLTAAINPANAANQNITWTSSDPSVATVTQNGTVTPISQGLAHITVTTEDGGFTATLNAIVFQDLSYSLGCDNFMYYLRNNHANIPSYDPITTVNTSRVRGLNIAGLEIECLKGINHFTALQQLLVQNNPDLTELNLDAEQMPNLQNLVLQGSGLISLSLDGFENLTHINAAGNNLESLRLKNLESLRGISVSNNYIDDLILYNLPDLRILWAENNKIPPGLNLAEFESLTLVDLRGNGLSEDTVYLPSHLDESEEMSNREPWMRQRITSGFAF